MSTSSFFLLSFAGPVVAGGLVSWVLWSSRVWLAEHWMLPMPTVFVDFIVTWIGVRWFIHNFIPVHCPKCNKRTAYEMEGIACRFRCRVCWKEF
ncbi:MAG: hypothetical protein K1X78_03745 [Verrucomicrobiaceae bacterium]|nr:hypothetical protein [Verrucomicrobiaceae bacterium]